MATQQSHPVKKRSRAKSLRKSALLRPNRVYYDPSATSSNSTITLDTTNGSPTISVHSPANFSQNSSDEHLSPVDNDVSSGIIMRSTTGNSTILLPIRRA